MTTAQDSHAATAWLIAETFGARACPRGCGELIYPSSFDGDDADVEWEVPYGTNETDRHTRDRCNEGRRSGTYLRLAEVESETSEVMWSRHTRLSVDREPDRRSTVAVEPIYLATRQSEQYMLTLTHMAPAMMQWLAERRAVRLSEAVSYLALDVWPMVDEARWHHFNVARLMITDIEWVEEAWLPRWARDPHWRVEAQAVPELKTGESIRYGLTDELPTDLPPRWATADAD